jgi:hypothetical protein
MAIAIITIGKVVWNNPVAREVAGLVLVRLAQRVIK